MPIFIQSPDPQDIIGLFRPSRYDAHCQAYLRVKLMREAKAAHERAWAGVVALQAQMIAEIRARRVGA